MTDRHVWRPLVSAVCTDGHVGDGWVDRQTYIVLYKLDHPELTAFSERLKCALILVSLISAFQFFIL